MDLDDGVIDIEQFVSGIAGGGWIGMRDRQPGEPGVSDQGPGGDRAKLGDVQRQLGRCDGRKRATPESL